MIRTLVDMYVKQPGSYRRLMDIAKADYPSGKILMTRTVILYGHPVLLLTIDTQGA